jgi:arylsulfatase A-like enzyme
MHVKGPNILIIVTDDQRDTLRAMPNTRRLFGRGGTRFTSSFATTPLCCPSRASIFSGQYAHNHRVTHNTRPKRLDQHSTLQHYLDEAGYQTAAVGKYFNDWDLANDPPSFDDWAIGREGYYNVSLNSNSEQSKLRGYFTNYIADRAVSDLEAFDPHRPWMLYIATTAPHPPFRVERRFRRAPVGTWDGNAAVEEIKRRDKPVVKQQRKFDRAESERVETHVFGPRAALALGRSIRARQIRTLMSVDRLVARVFSKLKERGEQNETLAFFLSDNGTLWGEHGLIGKRLPYSQSVGIPLLMRWPRHVATDARDDRMAANIDIAPTVLDAVGLRPDPDYPIDGASLLRLSSRRRLLLEQWGGGAGRWASLRTPRYQYVEYYRGGHARSVRSREYYDLVSDPWQLHNLLGDRTRSNDPDVERLSRHLASDRRCAGVSCP